VPLRREFLT